MAAVFKKRLDLRVAEDEKNTIEEAAALEGSSTSEFVRRTVQAAARDTIQSHAVARLSLEGSRKFVAALKNPPPPNEHLRALARDFGDEVGK